MRFIRLVACGCSNLSFDQPGAPTKIIASLGVLFADMHEVVLVVVVIVGAGSRQVWKQMPTRRERQKHGQRQGHNQRTLIVNKTDIDI